ARRARSLRGDGPAGPDARRYLGRPVLAGGPGDHQRRGRGRGPVPPDGEPGPAPGRRRAGRLPPPRPQPPPTHPTLTRARSPRRPSSPRGAPPPRSFGETAASTGLEAPVLAKVRRQGRVGLRRQGW